METTGIKALWPYGFSKKLKEFCNPFTEYNITLETKLYMAREIFNFMIIWWKAPDDSHAQMIEYAEKFHNQECNL